MNRAQIVNLILTYEDRAEALPTPLAGRAPFGRRRGPLYESSPLLDAEDVLLSLGEESLAAILRQRFPPPRVT